MRRLVLPALLASACAPDVPAQPSYERDVAPILAANCIRCHGATDAVGMCFRVDEWAASPDPTGACGDSRFGVGDPFLDGTVASRIVARAGTRGDMPPAPAAPLTERQRDILEAWAAAGYPRGNASGGPDGGVPAALTVTVQAPNGGEIFRLTQSPATVRWLADSTESTALTVDVVAVHGTTEEPIATAIATTAGVAGELEWDYDALPLGSDYRLRVTAHDPANPDQSAVDESDGSFSLAPVPQAVSFAGQLQPILTASCTGTACHDNANPASGLNLTAGQAYGFLVGVPSDDCGATAAEVEAGDPETSYLMWKLRGVGQASCYTGTRMPKAMPALSAAQLIQFEDWILNGAPDN